MKNKKLKKIDFILKLVLSFMKDSRETKSSGDIMSKHGFADFASSSMDFASEYGFKTDDGAKKIISKMGLL